jgi:aminopeptidase N
MVEAFVAHEVAHQWWGIQVDNDSYHDTWLSEAFAEYSGMWYMQLTLKENEIFFDLLEEYKSEIINNRKYLFSSGQEAGPIWLGPRTNSSETNGDYQLIIYKKGAWVIHMLRNMLLDLKTMNESKFENMMRDFYNSFKGKKATTKDFQLITEKHCAMNMDWFFNQWIYSTAIPDYNFSYKTTITPEGKYKVKCRIVQTNGSDDFKIYPIILIKFKDDKFARLRIEVRGNKSEYDLPLMPMMPEEIIFNDLSSILCNFNYTDWE